MFESINARAVKEPGKCFLLRTKKPDPVAAFCTLNLFAPDYGYLIPVLPKSIGLDLSSTISNFM